MRKMCEDGGGGGIRVVVDVVVVVVNMVVVVVLLVVVVVEDVSNLVVDVSKVVVVGLAKNFLVEPITLPTVGKFGIFLVAKLVAAVMTAAAAVGEIFVKFLDVGWKLCLVLDLFLELLSDVTIC